MKKANVSFGQAAMIILAAASTRLLPHPPNFTAIGALALFGGTYFSGKNFSWLIPFLALFISDVVLNSFVYSVEFNWYSLGTYIAFALVYLMGRMISGNISVVNVFAGSFSASLIFFLVSNLFFWQGMSIYSKDWSGLVTCFTAALPFFWNTFAGDITFTSLMFGAYYLSSRQLKLA